MGVSAELAALLLKLSSGSPFYSHMAAWKRLTGTQHILLNSLKIWFVLVRSGLVFLDLVCGTRSGLVRSGIRWSGLYFVISGLIWSMVVWSSLVRTGLIWAWFVWIWFDHGVV